MGAVNVEPLSTLQRCALWIQIPPGRAVTNESITYLGEHMKTEEIVRVMANRRNFLKGAGMTGIGLAGAAMIGSKLGMNEQKVAAASYSDGDILNFALNLEYLEAEFYTMATFGTTLVKLGIISKDDETGPTTGGNKVPDFSSKPEANMATALRVTEIAHVVLLREALGSAAAKKPAINLDALGYGFSSVNSFLKLARQFEDVGVSAYLGAAPRSKARPTWQRLEELPPKLSTQAPSGLPAS